MVPLTINYHLGVLEENRYEGGLGAAWIMGLRPVGLEACLSWRQYVLAGHREKELSWTHLFNSVPSQEHTCHSVQCYLSNLSSELLTENSQNRLTNGRS